MDKVNIVETLPMLVGYRIVSVKDTVTQKDILALYKVHLDSEGKVWGLTGKPLFLAEDRDQLMETVDRYKQDLQEELLQADMMFASAEQDKVHAATDFPEPGATNPLETLNPKGQSDSIS